MEVQNFKFKEKISHYLDDFSSPIGITINLVILGLILLSSGIFVVETYHWSGNILGVLDQLDKMSMFQ